MLYTIGHAAHPIEPFLSLLRDATITVVADVRSVPYSGFAPQYNAPALGRALAAAGIRYVEMGDALGGRPQAFAEQDADGHARYDVIAATPRFATGLARLRAGTARHRIALLCSEEDPARCHRHLLIGRVLRETGVELTHLRGDGRQESDRVVAKRTAPQHDLFTSPGPGSPPWRSPGPVPLAR